jgi:hypothetical protein
MKRILILLLIGLSSNLIFAQDLIVKQNGDEIKSKILEITIETIKYKDFEFQDGPTRNINISDVFMIIYENGKREKFSVLQSQNSEEENPISKENNGNVNKRGFIGLELGANVPIGKFADANDGAAKLGFQLNLINFGYLFSDNIGITATWFGAVNPIDGFTYSKWSHGGILVGPLFSFPVSEKVVWDIKPMIGMSWAFISNSSLETDLSVAFNIGTGFRFNISRLIALTSGIDFTNAKFRWNGADQSMGTLAIKGGLAFRLN